MIEERKQMYRDRIDLLQKQILEQQKQINDLKKEIELITSDKEYDC